MNRLRVSQLVGICVASVVAAGLVVLAAAPVVAVMHGGRPRSWSRHDGLQSLPLAARGPVAAALGRTDPVFRVRGLRASNPGERLGMSFGRSGVVVVTGGRRIGLRLDAVGRTGTLSPVGSVLPSAGVNRVSYTRAGLREWYANGPLGVEQGFDLARRPVGLGPLILTVGVSGVRSAQVRDAAVSLSGPGVNLR